MSSSKIAYTAHKAYTGAATAFVAMLFAQVGADPDHQVFVIQVLASALFSPWTGAAIDAPLLQQSLKALWAAILGGTGVHQAVYWMPNQLKDLAPMAGKLLAGLAAVQPKQPEGGYQPVATEGEPNPPPRNPSAGAATAAAGPMLGLCLVMLLGAAMLSGCAGNEGAATKSLEDFGADLKETAEYGPTRKLADDLLGEAAGPDHRSVRLCMIFAGVTEEMTYRVTHFDTDYAAEALGHVYTLQGVQRNLDASGDNVWFETDVKLATLELTDILVEVGKDRVPRLLSNLAGGVNVLGVADRARVAAAQADLAAAVIRDTKALIARVNANDVSADDARTACQARMEKNRARLAAITGAG